jgi:hypothetical protein
VLGLADVPLPPGVSFPEQSACPAADIAALTAAGVVLRAHGCTLAELARGEEEPSYVLPEPILEGER